MKTLNPIIARALAPFVQADDEISLRIARLSAELTETGSQYKTIASDCQSIQREAGQLLNKQVVA
jgi:hypothetical protein